MKNGNTIGIKILFSPVLSVLYGSLLVEQKLTDINWMYFLITALACVFLTWMVAIMPMKNKISRLIFIVIAGCPISVFLGWCMQAGVVSWRPAVASLPLLFLLAAVIFTDDLLRYNVDKRNGNYSLVHFLVSNLNDAKLVFSGIHECLIDAYILLVILLLIKIIPPFALLPLALILVFKELFAQISKAAYQEAKLIDNDNAPKPLLHKVKSNVFAFYLKFSLILSLGLIFDKVYFIFN